MNETEPKRPVRSIRRVIRLGVIALLLCGLAAGYYEFWLRRPIGEGPVHIPVDVAEFDSVWSERPVLLLGLGDSITAGFGSSPGRSHFDLIAHSRNDDFGDIQGICLKKVLPNLKTQNSALSGTTSIELLENSLPRIERQPNDVFGIVLLTTGGNDIIHNYGQSPPREGAMYGATLEQAEPWIENFQKRLGVILDEIESRFPGGCTIYLGNIYDPTDNVGDTQNAGLPRWPDGLQILDRYNEIIAGHCETRKNVHLVDIHSTFLGHGIHCRKFWMSHYSSKDPHYWYFDNLEDPNDRGYDALRRVYLNEISTHLRGWFGNTE
ncbi:MAG TPA: SGNH/GDSL hydrolase family protein [Planctomicrobium sp.]|nr:SGNH/GDSL hydrolase family protein [Planctomicrobium sp.]